MILTTHSTIIWSINENVIFVLSMSYYNGHLIGRRGLVVDIWIRDQEVLSSSRGCARLTLSPWERLFTCLSSPHTCVKRVFDYRQYARVTRHL